MNYFFNLTNYPDFLDIPLKDTYLSELSILLREQRDLMIEQEGKEEDKEILRLGSLFTLYSDLAHYFENAFDDAQGKQPAVTLAGIDAVLGHFIASASASIEETSQHIRSAGASGDQTAINDVIKDGIAMNLRHDFSACLAAQEDRVADYQQLMDRFFAGMKQQIDMAMPKLKLLPEEEKLETAAMMSGSFSFGLALAKRQQDRRSPIAPLTQYRVKKAQETYEGAVANMFDIDTGTRAGKIQLEEKLHAVELTIGTLKKESSRRA